MPNRAPVLIMAHRRPAEFGAVLASVTSGDPRKIYIFCDGPRTQSEQASQEQILKMAQSPSKSFSPSINFQQVNLGLRKAVLTAIDWVFESEEEAIILEDDTLPVAEFFRYCDQALSYYRQEKGIQQIGGYNPFGTALRMHPFAKRHLVSPRMDCWGWATWSDRWEEFRRHSELPPSPIPREVPKRLFSEIQRGNAQAVSGQLDSWAYSWAWFALSRGTFSIVPLENLVFNLGFGPGATHTRTGRSARVSQGSRSRALPSPSGPDHIYVFAAVYLQTIARVWFRIAKRLKKVRRFVLSVVSFPSRRARAYLQKNRDEGFSQPRGLGTPPNK